VIVLDTNVVSELMRPKPDPGVLRWFGARGHARFHVTAITVAEMLLGLELLPRGKRRDAMEVALRQVFDSDFDGRVLAFGSDAASYYAQVVATRRRAGRPIQTMDAQIAAIARAHGCAVATRNVDDFAACGVEVLDPWRSG
jgi:predicted nucleic acid-binding protein